MHYKYFILLLLLCPLVLANDIVSFNNISYDGGKFVNTGPAPGELVREYCGKVQIWGAVLVIFGTLFWITEPKIKKLMKKEQVWIFECRDLMFMYKWLGIGILFMGAYTIIRLSIV